ncbi:hypothetical protein PRIPAC_82154 [Pristionchus pacificus]|uniref:phosphoglucomutase (alpha-D-glucose-1,6-bisphosphate-dependent) n=1 Tax=Pristionchus pacificus TaxID=54126 RepID=A0A2A6C3E0_PRIPA|nr:hypothetical protein PRIPAC_82154 [Pristionchus pacificus]|eukprot:PDM72541.1 hypothetical protein PRIPAC_38975 [Pristionchus pacificus]
MSSDRLPSLMEPFHQLHSSTYEVDKRQPLMYPYKMHYQVDGGIILTASHNPGGPKGDFGIKFNCENGGPAPDHVTDAIHKITTEISSYSICRDINVDTGIIGHHEFDVDGMGKYIVDVIDSVKDYVELMKTIFDFPTMREYMKGLGGNQLRILIDSMHGATGPYVSTIFNDLLGCVGTDLLRTVPKPDFGGCYPDPNLTYAKDLVDRMRVGEVDMGAAFDGDGDRNMILGKSAFFVCPSDSLAVIANHIDCIPYFKNINVAGEEREKDGIWALLAWLQILAVKRKSVEEIVKEHWAEYGRNVVTRYDYENVESGGANLLMTFLEASMNASKLQSMIKWFKYIELCIYFESKELSANGVTYKVAHTDNFEYTDPVDGSVAKKQGLRVLFEDGSRLVFRLSGSTQTIGIDCSCKMEQFTGRKAPH